MNVVQLPGDKKIDHLPQNWDYNELANNIQKMGKVKLRENCVLLINIYFVSKMEKNVCNSVKHLGIRLHYTTTSRAKSRH